MKKIKSLIKNVCPRGYKILAKTKDKFSSFAKKSYSQFGEDLVLSTFLDMNKKGFYVDVGAHHPKRLSNTYFYYKRGWSGINIDANPDSVKKLEKYRKRDRNLLIGVTNEKSDSVFYTYKEPAFNTFSLDRVKTLEQKGVFFKNKIIIETNKLSDILDQCIQTDQKIDFMSIDIEGFDIEALSSNNWDKYSPSYIIVEDHNFEIEKCEDSVIYSLLNERGYKLISIANLSLIFKHE